MNNLPIKLPADFTPVVPEGDTIKKGEVLARKQESSPRTSSIPLAKLLNVSPKKARKLLLKNPGDMVKEGEQIATHGHFIYTTEVVSNITGTVLRFDETSGDLVVERATLSTDEETADEIVSPFDGNVLSVSTGEIVLSVKQQALSASKGYGETTKGELLLATSHEGGLIHGSDISVEMIGGVVLGATFLREAMVKASGMGVSGLITLTVSPEDISFLNDKKMLLPIVVVDQEVFATLAKMGGKTVYLDPTAKTITYS